MFKNVASQKIAVYAFDSTTGAPKTGDAANITAYVSKDFGAVTVLGDITATEQDATNGKGLYLFDLTQAETNADNLQFSGKSSTANIYIVPRWIDTLPNRFTTLVIDAAGLVDANTVKLGPTGSGTAQTARDIGASVVAASVTARVTANADQINGSASAASNLGKSAKAIVRGTCSGGSTTTAVVSSMTTPAALTATGQLIGRTILFDDDTTTAALQGQASNITNSTTGATPTITFTAMTTAPANGDTFSVV